MPVSEIRESIEKQTFTMENDIQIIQKKVNLQSGFRHEVMACDIFQDSVLSSDSVLPLYVEFFVSPFPIIYSEMSIALNQPNRGPAAGNDTVLFKANTGPMNFVEFQTINQFPSPQVAAGPTFSFYTPTLYVTAILHGSPGAFVENFAYSFFLKVDGKKASTTSFGLGMIRERSVAQGINLMNQGRTIPKAANVGQVFPQWKYGGIRPERMLNGTAARNFWLNYSADQSEQMLGTANIRTYIKGARSMSGYDKAFGLLDPVKGNIPDWLRFGLNRGLVAGPIRSQQPPRKQADNGNTLMF